MKKKLAGVFIVLLLTGCGTNIEKNKPTTEDIFKEELVAVSEIGESVGKSLSEEINLEEIEEVFSKIFELDVFESYSAGTETKPQIISITWTCVIPSTTAATSHAASGWTGAAQPWMNRSANISSCKSS